MRSDRQGSRWSIGLILLLALVLVGTTLTGLAQAVPPVVKVVPWVATNTLIPHDTYATKAIRLKGTSDVSGANIQWTWEFGDGTPVAAGIVSNPYIIEATHTYAGPVGTVFTARLTVQNTTTGESANTPYYVRMQNRTLDVEVNVAIDEGLWYLHKNVTRSGNQGYWGSYTGPATAANVNAFFVNGHAETGAASNPYTETVQRGMRFLFTRLNATAIGLQVYPAPIGSVNPDGNGNGLAIYADYTYPYSGGVYMDAIVASGTPDAMTTTGGANVIGRTYRAIVQDMVDGYAYGQTDTGPWMGGWGYDWNNGASDNSVNQWAAIGFLGGESIISNGPDGIAGTSDDVKWASIPAFVKAANRNSLNNTQATTANCGATYDGAFAYTNNYCYFPWGPYGTTPAGMVQMVMDGIGRGNAQWDRTENFIRNNFCNTGNSNSAIRAYYYGLFSFTKAMLLSPGGGIQFLANQPGNTNPIDWYAAEIPGDACNGVARTLVNDQVVSDGHWDLHNVNGYHTDFSTGWAIIMLNRTVFSGGNPVAVAKATPNPAVASQTITLDGSDSFHQDSTKSIVSWAWDLDNNGTFEASGPIVTTSFPAVANYIVKLRVTDNAPTPATADTSLTVVVSTPPLAPTANAGGPYSFCPATPLWSLDGTGSKNPDDGLHELGAPGDFIRAFDWDLDGNSVFDNATGATPDVKAYFGSFIGSRLISLRVTDNTKLSFPSSGMADLTSTAAAEVIVRAGTDPACACITDLTARAKPGKVQLVWTNTAVHHYNVYRGVANGGPYLMIGSTTSPYSTYLDETVFNGTTYYYVVRRALLNGDEVCQSNQASARPVATR
jgi:hypothetical protein